MEAYNPPSVTVYCFAQDWHRRIIHGAPIFLFFRWGRPYLITCISGIPLAVCGELLKTQLYILLIYQRGGTATKGSGWRERGTENAQLHGDDPRMAARGVPQKDVGCPVPEQAWAWQGCSSDVCDAIKPLWSTKENDLSCVYLGCPCETRHIPIPQVMSTPPTGKKDPLPPQCSRVLTTKRNERKKDTTFQTHHPLTCTQLFTRICFFLI